MPLGMEVGLSPGYFVLDGDPAPSQKGGGARGRNHPQFSAHVYCGQTARWIKMAIGMEVGLDPVHIVLDGDTAPLPKKGAEPPISAHLYLTKRLHGSRCHWYGGRPRPRRRCVRWRLRSPATKKGNFRSISMATAAKRLDGSRCHLVLS